MGPGPAVVQTVDPCLPFAKRLDPVRDEKESEVSLAWDRSHIVGAQSSGTSSFIPFSILMALIFPLPSPPPACLMVLPSGSREPPLERATHRAHLSLWVGASAFCKRSSLSPRHGNSSQQGTSVGCTAWAASTVRPAGLSRFPCGFVFSNSEEENQRWSRVDILRVRDSPFGNS